MSLQKEDILQISDKLDISCLPRTTWLIISCSSYFAVTLLASRQNMRNSENIGHISLETVR